MRHKVLAVRPLLEVIRQCDVAARSPDRQSSPDSLSGTSERRIPTYRARGRAAAAHDDDKDDKKKVELVLISTIWISTWDQIDQDARVE